MREGNAGGRNEGAGGGVLMSADEAEQRGLQLLGRMASYATAGLDPSIMGGGPIFASRKALDKAGWKAADLDLVEANEAFAAQSLAVLKELKLLDKQDIVNVRGGAIALGHPLGCSGSRITGNLAHVLHEKNASIGLATMCIGLGQGVATIVERMH